MNNQIIMRIFGSLQGLERCLKQVKQLLPSEQDSVQDIVRLIPQQEEALLKMRRLANKLQLEIAKKNWPAAVRTMQIIYGLNHMIRADLHAAFAKLTNAEGLPVETKSKEVGKENILH